MWKGLLKYYETYFEVKKRKEFTLKKSLMLYK
jgi:hypothetical protein